MEFLPLLGKQLKDDEVIDLLEWWEADVIYDFDRLHEGQPDEYSAASKPDGIQLKFNVSQKLDTVFLYIIPDDGFEAFSLSDCDVPFFETSSDVEAHGAAQGAQVSKGEANLLGINRSWVRLEFGTHAVHYEFKWGDLAMITISRAL